MKADKKIRSTVEVELPRVTHERLDPIIGFLTELLAKERIQEFEQNDEAGKQ